MIDTGPAETIFIPKGFSFSAGCAGIKPSGRPDIAFIACEPQASAAAAYTKNQVVAAPITVGRASLRASRGQVRAVIVNSGNANCATGVQGLNACKKVCSESARLLGVPPREILPSSTGIIGVTFPTEQIVAALPQLVRQCEMSESAARRFADAILTTDTRPKIASSALQVAGKEVRLLGVAKGSGMIHPRLATMLVYILTDVAATPAELRRLLLDACADTFNCISVDGDTSTNDTVLLLASGRSGVTLSNRAARKNFQTELKNLCRSLAEQIVSDGEGVRHVIRLSVEKAKSRVEAMQVARAICHSPLVKTAWAGADPNWGRILAAVGNSGVKLDAGRINIFIGQQRVCQRGQFCEFDKNRAHQDLTGRVSLVRVELGRGPACVTFYGTDLTDDYVHINAEYST